MWYKLQLREKVIDQFSLNKKSIISSTTFIEKFYLQMYIITIGNINETAIFVGVINVISKQEWS